MDVVPFHIGITTDDLLASRATLSAAFGLSWTDPVGGDSLLLKSDGTPRARPMSCVSREGPIHIDLMEGKRGTIFETTGTRLHHFSYWTDNLRADIERLAGEGWRLEVTKEAADGQPCLFAYLIRDDGFRLELVDRQLREMHAARFTAEP